MIKFPLVFIYFVQVSLVVVLVLFFESSVLFASFAYQFVNKIKVSWNRLYCLLKISDANFPSVTNHRLIFTTLAESAYECIFSLFLFSACCCSFLLSDIKYRSIFRWGLLVCKQILFPCLATNDFVNR